MYYGSRADRMNSRIRVSRIVGHFEWRMWPSYCTINFTAMQYDKLGVFFQLNPRHRLVSAASKSFCDAIHIRMFVYAMSLEWTQTIRFFISFFSFTLSRILGIFFLLCVTLLYFQSKATLFLKLSCFDICDGWMWIHPNEQAMLRNGKKRNKEMDNVKIATQ